MTLEALSAYGANTAEGLARCMNNEPFYLRMVGMVLSDENFNVLRTAVEAGDARTAFNAAHALKGTTGNVSLTPLYEPICRLTEILRGKDELVDKPLDLLGQIMDKWEEALKL